MPAGHVSWSLLKTNFKAIVVEKPWWKLFCPSSKTLPAASRGGGTYVPIFLSLGSLGPLPGISASGHWCSFSCRKQPRPCSWPDGHWKDPAPLSPLFLSPHWAGLLLGNLLVSSLPSRTSKLLRQALRLLRLAQGPSTARNSGLQCRRLFSKLIF